MQNKLESNPKLLPQWQTDLINQIINATNDYYCLPAKIDKSKEDLKIELINKCMEINETFLKDGSDSPLKMEEDYKILISKINDILHGFDTHLELAYDPEFITQMQNEKRVVKNLNSAKFNLSGGSPTEKQLMEWDLSERTNPTTSNYGFIDYQGSDDVIPDNIGYVNISYLINPKEGAEKDNVGCHRGPNALIRLNTVMEGFREKQGIILDLSVTKHGGSPEMVKHIVSFFIPQGTLINTIHNRVTNQLTQYESIESLKLLDKPVILLVGPETFSGREEIAYDLQQFNKTLEKNEQRFVVMGQRTKGGAHPTQAFPLMDMQTKEIHDKLILFVPFETSINPISGTNWEDGPIQEGKEPGIQPDIIIPKEENALESAVAQLSLLISQQSKIIKPEITQQYKDKVKETKQSYQDSSVTIEVENKDTITPLQTTLKPWGK